MTLIGSAPISTPAPPSPQHDALDRTGCQRIFADWAAGAKAIKPDIADALAYLRALDTLVVWSLDHLNHSMSNLIGTIGELVASSIGLNSLTQFERDLIQDLTQTDLSEAAALRKRSLQGSRPERHRRQGVIGR